MGQIFRKTLLLLIGTPSDPTAYARMPHRYRLPGRQRSAQQPGRRRRPLRRRPPGRVADHAGGRERHDGRAAAAGRATGRAVPRRLLPQQPAVPVRRDRAAR